MCNYPAAWGLHRLSTGVKVAFEGWQVAKSRRSALEAQSVALAHSLESVGYPAISNKSLAFVGTCTGHVEYRPMFRPICFIPSVAKIKRGAMLRDLSFYQSHHKAGRFFRYMVLTNGQPCPVVKLQENIQRFNRKISKWAAAASSDFGIDIFFRGLEFPVNTKTETAHLHANILMVPFSRLSAKKWSAFLDFTHSYFKTVLKDAGVLREPREAIKYPFKPDDLKDAHPVLLRTLAEQLHGQRIIESLGSFRAWRAARKVEGVKTVWHDGAVILARSYKRESLKKSEVTPMSKSNRLVAILPPQAHGSNYLEPVIVIQGDVETVLVTDESLGATISEFQHWWIEKGAPFNLDNSSSSVQELMIKNANAIYEETEPLPMQNRLKLLA